MRIRSLWLCLTGFFFTTGIASAQDSLLDLLREEACTFGVRDFSALKKKGDKFLKDAGIPMNPRPSQLIEEVFRMYNVAGAVEEKAPAAIMVFSHLALKRKLNFDFEKLAVALIRIKDVKTIEKNFNLPPGTLKPGKIQEIKNRQRYGRFLYLRGNNLFLGDDEQVVRYAAEKAKPMRKRLTAGQKKSIGEADVVVHLAFEAWGETVMNQLLAGIPQIGGVLPNDPDERKLFQQLVQAARDVSYVIGAVRIDNGMGLSVVAGLKKKPADNTRKLLALLRSGEGASSLRNLPRGNLVAAHGIRGDGKATGMLIKVMLDVIFKQMANTKQLVSASERPIFVGVLKAVWGRLRGSKTAVYLNPNPGKQGQFSFLAVLDTRDAKEFLNEMKVIAKIAEGKNIDLTKRIEDGGKVDVEKLVRDLGSPRYRLRTVAMFKLGLIGEPALPYLLKARNSKDDEVIARAARLIADIQQRSAERRAAAVSQNPFRRIRPTFVMVSGAEKRGGHSVDVIRIKLSTSEKIVQKQLQQMLGPQWNNMRVVVHKNQIVLLLGSNLKLLDQTLTNIVQNRLGLASSKSLSELYRYSNTARKFELHVSLQNLLGSLAGKALLRNQSATVTSLGLSIEPDQVQLDAWIPTPEARALAKITVP